jgi:hypothetical protein
MWRRECGVASKLFLRGTCFQVGVHTCFTDLFTSRVSLKTKLSPSELHVLILDVRRRIESDGSGEKADMSGR